MESYKGKIEGSHYYGKHVLFDCKNCNEELLSIDFMKSFLVEIADEIKMIRFKEPMVYRFGEGIEVGLSGLQLITTSLISFHTNDSYRDLYLDVFSCKWYDEKKIIELIEEKLSPSNINVNIIIRK